MISIRNALFIVLTLSLGVSAAMVPQPSTYKCPEPCKSPLVRKEWRKLKTAEKKAYIDAVKCLQSRPSISDPTLIPGARTRYDDFHAVHITHAQGLLEGTGGIHFVGQFFPWHRYFMIAHEKALREECGYKGAQPYWDWTLDSGPGKDIRNSSIFDPVTGFGGNGQAGVPPPPVTPSRPHLDGETGGGCVTNGPFKSMTLNLGPGPLLDFNPRCLSRSINPTMANYLTYANIAPLWNTTRYNDFRIVTEGNLKNLAKLSLTFHGAGHFVVGGEADDFMSSNAEPLFYLHHTFLDFLWSKWQSMDPTGARYWEIGGPQIPFTVTPEVTLDFPIDLGACGASIPIRQVMDIRPGNKGGIGCYVYEY